MTVYVLIREDQNEHGYIDTSIVGVFSARSTADEHEAGEWRQARAEGLAIEDDDCDGDWQVSWRIEAHEVADLPIARLLNGDQMRRARLH